MAGTVVVSFNVGPAKAANSSIVASPTSAPADGTSSIGLTLTLKDGTGNPVPGKGVFISGHGNAALSPLAAVTNSAGEAFFTLTDTHGETLNVAGVDSSDNISTVPVTVEFVAPQPDSLDITASSPTDADDGVTSITLTVTVKNGSNPVVGKSVSVQENSGASAVITPASAVTDSNGQATFSVTDIVAESVTFTPVDN